MQNLEIFSRIVWQKDVRSDEFIFIINFMKGVEKIKFIEFCLF